MIAAERTGRSAALVELDPVYADVIVQRWQAFTGERAVLETTGDDFTTVSAARQSVEQAA